MRLSICNILRKKTANSLQIMNLSLLLQRINQHIMKNKKAVSLKTLTKGNVWDIQENDVFRMWEAAEHDADLKDNIRRYTDIIRSAFEVEEVKVDKPEIIKKYEDRGFKVGMIKLNPNAEEKQKIAIKKRAIMRVTDLTYENILMGNGHADKAVEAWRSALEKDPDNADIKQKIDAAEKL